MTNILNDSKIMIIDDIPQNLMLLRRLLGKLGAQVFAFPSGEMALQSVAKTPVELILLDINMPIMNGYEVCQRLQADPNLREIPVIFISALNQTEDVVKGFEAGGVDYITKPFQVEEVEARVSVHLELHKKRKEVRELLGETLMGTIKALTELLAIANPGSYARTLKTNQLVQEMISIMGAPDAWHFKVAAMLSNLGILLPGQVQPEENVVAGVEDETVAAFGDFQAAAKVIESIPRLQVVAKILKRQADNADPDSDWKSWPTELLGAQILKVVGMYEWLVSQNQSAASALDFMREKPQQYHPVLLDNLQTLVIRKQPQYAPDTQETIVVPIRNLQPGMVLARNLESPSGGRLLAAGTEISNNLVQLINRWSNICSLSGTIHILKSDDKKTSTVEEEKEEEVSC